MSNIQKQHKISPAIAWLTIQKFIIFYCPLDGEHTIFHTAKELNYLREKYILEKIPDDQLLEYLKLEEKRHELQVQERNIREKRIMNAFMLTVILAAIVAVVYSLHENPTVLISILYIGGILAGIHVWNKKK